MKKLFAILLIATTFISCGQTEQSVPQIIEQTPQVEYSVLNSRLKEVQDLMKSMSTKDIKYSFNHLDNDQYALCVNLFCGDVTKKQWEATLNTTQGKIYYIDLISSIEKTQTALENALDVKIFAVVTFWNDSMEQLKEIQF